MSKVVSGIGNALGSVVKGAVNVVKSVGSGVSGLVKNIASSKLGKAVMIAAAIYFGGAALSGGFSSMGAGGSFFSGMGTGVANAASSLSTAWTSAMSGNFSQAGSALSSGFSGEVAAAPGTNALAGNYSVAGTTSAPAAAPAAPPAAAAPPPSPVYPQAPVVSPVTPPSVVPSTALPPTGTWDKIVSSPYTAPSLISGGMQVGGAIIQGKAQEKQLKDQREYEERMAREGRERYNANAGARLWSSDQAPIYQSTEAAWDPYAEARARNAARYAPQSTGVVARYMPPIA